MLTASRKSGFSGTPTLVLMFQLYFYSYADIINKTKKTKVYVEGREKRRVAFYLFVLFEMLKIKS